MGPAANDDSIPTLTKVTVYNRRKAAIERAINENNAAVNKIALRCDQIQQTINDIKAREPLMPTVETPTRWEKIKALYFKIPPNLRTPLWCILFIVSVMIVL